MDISINQIINNMKKINNNNITVFYLLLAILTTVISVNNFTYSAYSQNQDKSYYILDSAKSYIRWEGKKLTGSHYGHIYFDSSWVELTNGKISNGEFNLNMNSIVCHDIEDTTMNKQLVKHLKLPDFFDSEQFPQSFLKFKLSIPNPTAKKGQPNYTIIADLSIKDSTNTITFPAVIQLNDKGMNATSEFKFDRTNFNIHFNSIKFFPNIGDKLIYDDITLQINAQFIRKEELDKILERQAKANKNTSK
ncbi:MAG: hypothetical protein B7C24_15015 [Bacteroidetes bacterium 4572_77]|nr:MAG: hypothetical protein B7C24_15015 [Bacteroidetes bacterium 4572_77]